MVRVRLLKLNVASAGDTAFTLRPSQAWFKAMDSDGGGTIDKDELKQKLEEIGMSSHNRAIREVLETVDTDGDGEITITEFMDEFPTRSRPTSRRT